MAVQRAERQGVGEKIPFFSDLGRQLGQRLIPLLRPVELGAGAVLFRQGDMVNGCYAVERGALIVSIPDHAGEEAWLALMGTGDLVGEIGLIDREPRSATVTALHTSTLWHLPAADFDRLCIEDVELHRRVAEVIAERLRAANRLICDQRLGLDGRLALTLHKLAAAFGEELEDGRILIRYRISQARLAKVAHASREYTNRQLRTWTEQGLISRVGNYYCLSRPEDWQRLGAGATSWVSV